MQTPASYPPVSPKGDQKPGRYSYGPASNGLYAPATPRYGKLVISIDQKIRIRGKETTLRLGKFPDMPLKKARVQAEANARAVAEDPRIPEDITFRELAIEYIDWWAMGGTWSPGGRSRQTWTNSVTNNAFPVIGDMHPREITSIDVFEILKEKWITKPKAARDLGQRITKIMQ